MKRALLLLRPKMLSIRNTLTAGFMLKRLPFLVMGFAVWGLIYAGTYRLVTFIREIQFVGEMLAAKLLGMTFFGLGAFLLLSNLVTAISSFYLSKDVQLLLSRPVAVRDMLFGKSVESVMNSSWMVMSFVPPFFLAYGIAFDAPPAYYVMMLFALVPFLLIPAGLGIAAVHLLVRLFPVKRTKAVLLGLSLLLFLALYWLMQSVATDSEDSIEGLINALMRVRIDSPFLPGFWMQEAIMPLLRGGKPDPLFPFALATSGAFLIMVSAIAGARWYRENVFRLNDATGKTRPGSVFRIPPRRHIFLWKDAKTFFRDAEQWSQLVIIGALLMVYVYNFKVLPLDSFAAVTPYFKEIMAVLNVILAGLVLTAVSARFIYVSVSLEGEAFWIAKSSPVRMRVFLRSKYLFAFLPITLLVLILVLLSNVLMGQDPPLILLALGTTLILCFSVSGLAAGLGAMYPRFQYENIASVSMGLGSVTFMFIAFCLVLVTVALEGWAVYVYRAGASGGAGAIISGSLPAGLAVSAMLAINGMAFLIPIRLGIKRLEGDIREKD